eukprot:15460971-Alexandrium_andersonii.AAC.1
MSASGVASCEDDAVAARLARCFCCRALVQPPSHERCDDALLAKLTAAWDRILRDGFVECLCFGLSGLIEFRTRVTLNSQPCVARVP